MIFYAYIGQHGPMYRVEYKNEISKAQRFEKEDFNYFFLKKKKSMKKGDVLLTR